MLTWFLKAILVIGLLFIVGRLFELQVIKGAYFLELSEGNRIRRVPTPAPRGEIHARGGEILVGNKKILKKLKFSPGEGFEKMDENNLSEGDDVVAEWEREYKLKSDAAHITGYVGKVNSEELGKVNPNCPDKGIRDNDTQVGRSGLEEYYECELSGTDGEDLFEVDSKGNLVRRLGRKPPIPGKNIVTNIDYDLQEKVASFMSGKKGAVVITDTTGEVLSLYSNPTFDPNVFIEAKSSEITKLIENNDKPFFNRAIGGLFHPGSVFKPVVAIAALESEKIDKHYLYEDTGKIEIKTGFGDFSYSNWFYTQSGGVEGKIGLARALTRSTDTFFYKVGEIIGPDTIADFASKVDLGKKSEIDLPGEVAGLIPTPAWKKEVRGENWFLGNTYHMSIGQGDVGLSPISINMATNSVLTGVKCRPVIVGESDCKDLGIKPENIALVKEGMEGACSHGGTANVFFDFNPKVACKTGTAQTGLNDKTHAWFTVMAPIEGDEDKRVMMTVLVEEGGEGSQVAAPIAKDILSWWFSR